MVHWELQLDLVGTIHCTVEQIHIYANTQIQKNTNSLVLEQNEKLCTIVFVCFFAQSTEFYYVFGTVEPVRLHLLKILVFLV